MEAAALARAEEAVKTANKLEGNAAQATAAHRVGTTASKTVEVLAMSMPGPVLAQSKLARAEATVKRAKEAVQRFEQNVVSVKNDNAMAKKKRAALLTSAEHALKKRQGEADARPKHPDGGSLDAQKEKLADLQTEEAAQARVYSEEQRQLSEANAALEAQEATEQQNEVKIATDNTNVARASEHDQNDGSREERTKSRVSDLAAQLSRTTGELDQEKGKQKKLFEQVSDLKTHLAKEEAAMASKGEEKARWLGDEITAESKASEAQSEEAQGEGTEESSEAKLSAAREDVTNAEDAAKNADEVVALEQEDVVNAAVKDEAEKKLAQTKAEDEEKQAREALTAAKDKLRQTGGTNSTLEADVSRATGLLDVKQQAVTDQTQQVKEGASAVSEAETKLNEEKAAATVTRTSLAAAQSALTSAQEANQVAQKGEGQLKAQEDALQAQSEQDQVKAAAAGAEYLSAKQHVAETRHEVGELEHELKKAQEIVSEKHSLVAKKTAEKSAAEVKAQTAATNAGKAANKMLSAENAKAADSTKVTGEKAAIALAKGAGGNIVMIRAKLAKTSIALNRIRKAVAKEQVAVSKATAASDTLTQQHLDDQEAVSAATKYRDKVVAENEDASREMSSTQSNAESKLQHAKDVLKQAKVTAKQRALQLKQKLHVQQKQASKYVQHLKASSLGPTDTAVSSPVPVANAATGDAKVVELSPGE